MTAEKIADVGHSLEMVEVRDLRLYPSNSNKNRASFICNGRSYDGISVTDPCFYSARNETIDHALLVLSLPNRPFRTDGIYYKFIAKIFPI